MLCSFFSEISGETLPGIKEVTKKLSSFPFELNAKTSYGFMISEGMKFICLGPGETQEFRNKFLGKNSKARMGQT